MTEEKMQEAPAGLPGGYTAKIAGAGQPHRFHRQGGDGGRGHCPAAGLCHPAHQQGQPDHHGARPGDRPQGGPLRPCGHPGPDGALRHRRRHADGDEGGRPADAHPGRRILPHLHPGRQGLHRHGAQPLPRRPRAGRRGHPPPGRKEHGGAHRREGAHKGGRGGPGHRRRRLRLLRPQDRRDTRAAL